jgi:hypothetical protein
VRLTLLKGKKEHNGKRVKSCQSEPAAQVFNQANPALQTVRSFPRLYAQIWNVPYLFPRKCFGGQIARREKVELVKDEE